MEKICGECRYFRPDGEQPDRGTCRLGQLMGVFKSSMKGCRKFTVPGASTPQPVRRSSGGGARRTRSHVDRPVVAVSASALADAISVLTPEQLKMLLCSHLARQMRPGLELGTVWDGGTLELRPADTSTQSKLVPIEQYLHKLVMIRDNLRVLEQKINSHKLLQDGEKVDLQRIVSQSKSAILRAASDWQPTAAPDDESAAADALLKVLSREVEHQLLAAEPPALGDRWIGGAAVFVTEDGSVEEPLGTFFDRIMSVRDSLNALEDALNAQPRLTPPDRSGMITYIKRCHGSLTTFNVLLRDRADYFSGK